MTSETHPIERASVEQASDRYVTARERLEAIATADDLRLVDDIHDRLVALGWHQMAQARALLLTLAIEVAGPHRQQARDAGFAEGVERAASVADEKFTTGLPWSLASEGYQKASVEIATAIKALSVEANEGRCAPTHIERS